MLRTLGKNRSIKHELQSDSYSHSQAVLQVSCSCCVYLGPELVQRYQDLQSAPYCHADSGTNHQHMNHYHFLTAGEQTDWDMNWHNNVYSALYICHYIFITLSPLENSFKPLYSLTIFLQSSLKHPPHPTFFLLETLLLFSPIQQERSERESGWMIGCWLGSVCHKGVSYP